MGKNHVFFGGGAMANILKQAQKMQENLVRVKENLKNKIVESSSGGGMVRVKGNADQKILEIKIAREIVNPDDIEMLEDLVLCAVRDCLKQAREVADRELSQITGGISIPGLM